MVPVHPPPHGQGMHDITHPTATAPVPRPQRTSRFVTRWIAATVVVAVVFLGARHTIGPDTRGRVDEPTSLAPKVGTTPTTGERADVFDDVFADDALPDDPEPSPTLGKATATGATGSGWSMQYPESWTENDLGDGMVVFDAPNQLNVAMVRSRPFLGDSFEDQAAQELDDLRASLGDTEIVDVVSTTIDGRPVEQAAFYYTNPAGDLATVWVTWILDGDTVHLLAAEVPTSNDTLAAEVEDTLNTFRLDSTS